MIERCPFCGIPLNKHGGCDYCGPAVNTDLMPEEIDDVRQSYWSEGISRESREYIEHDDDLEYWESLKKRRNN